MAHPIADGSNYLPNSLLTDSTSPIPDRLIDRSPSSCSSSAGRTKKRRHWRPSSVYRCAPCTAISKCSTKWASRSTPTAARAALAKLDNLLPDEQRGEVDWARRSLVATGFHRAGMDELVPILSQLRRALRERRSIRIVYQGSAQTAPEARHVDPYALVHRWGWWYLIAYCHLRSALRSFRVDRISEISERVEGYSIPADDIAHHTHRPGGLPGHECLPESK